MGRPRLAPDKEELQKLLRAGHSHAEIAQMMTERHGKPVKPGTISAAVSTLGLSKAKPRYKDFLPWRVETKHLDAYPARMLRLYARRQEGRDIPENQESRLDSWLQEINGLGVVVAYSRDYGFFYAPPRPGVDNVEGNRPIREDVVTKEQFEKAKRVYSEDE